MKCPYCANGTTEVVETRDNEDITVTRRRRSCVACGKRFTTYERVEMVSLVVIKKQGARQNFDREKLAIGIRKATEKTAVLYEDIERIVDEIERELRQADSVEIESKKIENREIEPKHNIVIVDFLRHGTTEYLEIFTSDESIPRPVRIKQRLAFDSQ